MSCGNGCAGCSCGGSDLETTVEEPMGDLRVWSLEDAKRPLSTLLEEHLVALSLEPLELNAMTVEDRIREAFMLGAYSSAVILATGIEVPLQTGGEDEPSLANISSNATDLVEESQGLLVGEGVDYTKISNATRQIIGGYLGGDQR